VHRVEAKLRAAPPNTSALNLKLACTSGKNAFRFSKSNSAPSRPVVDRLRKNSDAPLSALMPEGTSSATMPPTSARSSPVLRPGTTSST